MATPRCSAHRSNGDPCKAYAVRGATVCVTHGGAAPRVREAAARRVAEEKAAAKMRLFAAPVDIDPAQALLELVHSAAGEVAYWRAEVSRMWEAAPEQLTWSQTAHEEGITPGEFGGHFDKDTAEAVPHVAYRMWVGAQERLAKFASAALKAGVQERQIKLAEDQGVLVAQVIRAVLDDLHLTSEQSERVSEVVPRHLRLLAATGA